MRKITPPNTYLANNYIIVAQITIIAHICAMKSLPQTVQSLIDKSPFIKEALSAGLVNNTSLARYLQQDVERISGKEASISAIRSAIDRMPIDSIYRLDKSLGVFMQQLGDINVRSDLMDITYRNSPSLMQSQLEFLKTVDTSKKYFFSFSKGVNETTIVISEYLYNQLESTFHKERQLLKRDNLAAISIMLPERNLDVYGVYYTILKQLAWKGINVVEIISTSYEITLVVEKADVKPIFDIFMSFKS